MKLHETIRTGLVDLKHRAIDKFLGEVFDLVKSGEGKIYRKRFLDKSSARERGCHGYDRKLCLRGDE